MTALREEVQFDHPDKTGLHFTTVYPWFVKTPLLDQLNIKLRLAICYYLIIHPDPDCMRANVCMHAFQVAYNYQFMDF